MEWMKSVYEALALIVAAAVSGVFAYAHSLAGRVDELEKQQAVQVALAKDKHDTVETLLKATASHEQRLAVIETVITDLKTLPALLREMVATSAAVKMMMEQHTERVGRLEDHVFQSK